MPKKVTKKQDAASIVGESLAEELDAQAKVERSDVLIELADTDIEEPEEADESDLEIDDLSESDNIEEESMVEKGNSGYLVADDGKGKPALPTKKDGKLDHRLMGAAWAALHKGFRGDKYEGKGKKEAITKLKKLYAREKMSLPTKAGYVDEEIKIEKEMDMENSVPSPEVIYKPYGGATTLSDAMAYMDAQDEQIRISTLWYMFTNVANNIMSDDSISEVDKTKSLTKAVSELKTAFTSKSLIDELSLGEGKYQMFTNPLTKEDIMETVKSLVEESKKKEDETSAKDTQGNEADMPMDDKKKKTMMKSNAKTEKSALDSSVEELYTSVQSALTMDATVEQKLQSVQPVLEKMGQAIVQIVQGSVATAKSETKPDETSKLVLDMLGDMKKSLDGFALELQTVKSQMANPATVTQSRIPAPRSITPDMMKSVVAKNQTEEIKPGSVKDIARRSVGITQ